MLDLHLFLIKHCIQCQKFRATVKDFPSSTGTWNHKLIVINFLFLSIFFYICFGICIYFFLMIQDSYYFPPFVGSGNSSNWNSHVNTIGQGFLKKNTIHGYQHFFSIKELNTIVICRLFRWLCENIQLQHQDKSSGLAYIGSWIVWWFSNDWNSCFFPDRNKLSLEKITYFPAYTSLFYSKFSALLKKSSARVLKLFFSSSSLNFT